MDKLTGEAIALKKKSLFILWICLYALCVSFGFVTQREAALKVLFTIFGLGSFVPGFMLLYAGYKNHDQKLLRQLRLISGLSLLLTLLTLLTTILCVGAGNSVGVILNIVLNIVSAPMFCIYLQGLAPFLWACLLIASFPKIVKK